MWGKEMEQQHTHGMPAAVILPPHTLGSSYV